MLETPVACRRLALLLIRVAEIRTHDSWRNLRHELQLMHLGAFRGPAGESHQRTDITSRQAEIFNVNARRTQSDREAATVCAERRHRS